MLKFYIYLHNKLKFYCAQNLEIDSLHEQFYHLNDKISEINGEVK